MNESIEFSYVFRDDEGKDAKEIRVMRRDNDGLNCSSICEAFVDFMESAGFSLDNVYDFFTD